MNQEIGLIVGVGATAQLAMSEPYRIRAGAGAGAA